MARSKKSRSQDHQPAWGQGNSKKAQHRRRLREAREAAISRRITSIRASPSTRLRHSAMQNKLQRPLDYGALTTQSQLLAKLPASNLNPQANRLKPSSQPQNPDVIDLTGDDHPIELPEKPTYEPRHSNQRPTAGILAKALGSPKPNGQAISPAVIDLAGSEVSFDKPNECLWANGKLESWSHTISPHLRLCDSKRTLSFSALDKPMFSFGQYSQQPLRFDITAKEILGLTSHSTFGQTQKAHETTDNGSSFAFNQPVYLERRQSTKSAVPFGEPQKPAPGFLRVAWVRQDPEILANWTPSKETSLEDLYKKYPEKRLRSIEPDTLELVAKTIQQIAEEAANNWVKSSHPRSGWDDSTDKAGGFCHFNDLSLQGVRNTVSSLLISSRATIQSIETMTLAVLVRMIDQSIVVCQMVKDNKCCELLQKAKEKVEWLPVGLDCKKLDIQRRAIKKLEEHRIKIRKELAQAKPAKQAKRLTEGDIQVLDWALVEFQEHRLHFVIEIFKTLKQLLEATA